MRIVHMVGPDACMRVRGCGPGRIRGGAECGTGTLIDQTQYPRTKRNSIEAEEVIPTMRLMVYFALHMYMTW